MVDTSFSAPGCTTSWMSGTAKVLYRSTASSQRGSAGPKMVELADSTRPSSWATFWTDRSRRETGWDWKYSGTGLPATSVWSRARLQTQGYERERMMVVVSIGCDDRMDGHGTNQGEEAFYSPGSFSAAGRMSTRLKQRRFHSPQILLSARIPLGILRAVEG